MINNSVAISQQQHAGQQQQPVAGPHHHDQERGGSAHGSRSSSHYSPQWSHVYVLNLEYHETMYVHNHVENVFVLNILRSPLLKIQ